MRILSTVLDLLHADPDRDNEGNRSSFATLLHEPKNRRRKQFFLLTICALQVNQKIIIYTGVQAFFVGVIIILALCDQ